MLIVLIFYHLRDTSRPSKSKEKARLKKLIKSLEESGEKSLRSKVKPSQHKPGKLRTTPVKRAEGGRGYKIPAEIMSGTEIRMGRTLSFFDVSCIRRNRIETKYKEASDRKGLLYWWAMCRKIDSPCPLRATTSSAGNQDVHCARGGGAAEQRWCAVR